MRGTEAFFLVSVLAIFFFQFVFYLVGNTEYTYSSFYIIGNKSLYKAIHSPIIRDTINILDAYQSSLENN